MLQALVQDVGRVDEQVRPRLVSVLGDLLAEFVGELLVLLVAPGRAEVLKLCLRDGDLPAEVVQAVAQRSDSRRVPSSMPPSSMSMAGTSIMSNTNGTSIAWQAPTTPPNAVDG